MSCRLKSIAMPPPSCDWDPCQLPMHQGQDHASGSEGERHGTETGEGEGERKHAAGAGVGKAAGVGAGAGAGAGERRHAAEDRLPWLPLLIAKASYRWAPASTDVPQQADNTQQGGDIQQPLPCLLQQEQGLQGDGQRLAITDWSLELCPDLHAMWCGAGWGMAGGD